MIYDQDGRHKKRQCRLSPSKPPFSFICTLCVFVKQFFRTDLATCPGRGRRSEGKDRGQRSEGRGRRERTEVRGRRSEVGGKRQRSEVRGRRSEDRGQRAEGRGQRAEGRGRRTDDACGRDDLDGWMKKKGGKWARFHSTFDIIEAVKAGRFPDKVIPVKFAPLRLRLFHGTSDDGASAAVDR